MGIRARWNQAPLACTDNMYTEVLRKHNELTRIWGTLSERFVSTCKVTDLIAKMTEDTISLNGVLPMHSSK